MFNRLQDIEHFDPAQIDTILARGDVPIVQFSKPGYSEELLDAIDAACREHGAKLDVRFYGHYRTGFDATWLSRLPNVASLSIDCLDSATNLGALFALTRLKRLSLGILDLGCPDILSRIVPDHLEELFLCETRKSDIELSPLSRCSSLRRLHVSGHTRGFDTLAQLERVSDLTLRSIPKKQSLAAVSDIRGLRTLMIILGGRTDIDELALPALTRLEVIWIRGLSDLGTLSRFPALQHLRVEDQLQLRAIDLTGAPPTLRHVSIFNCKNLREIGAIVHLNALTELRIGRTSLDFEALLSARLPTSLRCVAFYTGRKRADDPMRRRLDALGYTEFSRRPSTPT